MNGSIFNDETGNCAKLIAHKAGGLVQLYKNTATIICKLLIYIHTVQDIYMYIYIINDTYIYYNYTLYYIKNNITIEIAEPRKTVYTCLNSICT